MSYPSKYSRLYDYVSYQNTNPTRPLPATRVHADLNSLATISDETVEFLKLFTRADGALANSSVGYDQLSPSLQSAGLAPADAWETATEYVVGDNVVINSNLYRCAVAHTSGTFADDLAAGDWTLVAALPINAYLAGTGLQLNTLTFSIDATVATLAGAQVLTNKTVDGSSNTISNLTTAMFATNVVDTDGTFAANSDTRLPSQKAAKTYVDGKFGTNVATFLLTPSSANLRAALTDETGSGAAVFGTSPTIATPAVTGLLSHTGTDSVGAGARFFRANGTDYTEIYKTSGGLGLAANDALIFHSSSTASSVAALDRNGLFQTIGGVYTSGGAMGYATGAGGAVTQATNKSTGVTVNKACGAITMNNASLAANTGVSFTLTNSQIAATDVLVMNHVSGGTFGAYNFLAQCVAGSATINVRNITAGALGEAVVIQFAVIKGVSA
jgi:hypothetical protein